MIFIPLDIPQLSPLENTEIGTALLHHVHGTLSWFSLVIIYMCKKMFEYPSHSFTYSPIYFNFPPPPPMIYIINEFLKYDSKHVIIFFKILHKHYLQCKEITKAVTIITLWHKVNFSLQNKYITIVWKFKTICDSNVNITFLNLHSSWDLKHVEHEVI